MRFDLFPYGKPFSLILDIQVLRAVHLRISIFDPETKRLYIDRNMKMNKGESVPFKLPITPDRLRVELIDKNLPRMHRVFSLAQIKVTPDKKCPIELTEKDNSFVRFAKWFACESSRMDAQEGDILCQFEGFTILSTNRIMENGIEQTTPARISKDGGVIQVSRIRTRDFTVPMLIVMLFHEYAHKFKNEEYGKKESNELTADLIACHMALNLGFDSHEVRHCFREVFAKKDNKLNRRRMQAIEEFIAIFKRNEARRCKVNTK